MLTYFIFGENNYNIRVAQTTSTAVTMSVQDMTRLTNITASLTGVSYNNCESMLSFTASISNAVVGQEYRTAITNGIDTIYNGSVQVFASQSINKPVYKTQNDEFISHISDNEYIIIEQPLTSTTSTTTSTTSTSTTTTSTTTTSTTSTSTTTTTEAPQFVFVYLASSGSVPSDAKLFYRTSTVFFNDLGAKTPGVYPSYNLVQTLIIPPIENLRFGVTNLADANITFGTGSNSGQFTTNCGIVNPTLIPASSWSGSVDVYINIATSGGNYVLCP